MRFTAQEVALRVRSDSSTSPPPSTLLCGRAVDCWALGVTACELLTGYCLFKIDDFEQPSDMSTGTCMALEWQHLAGLHMDWVRAVPSHGPYLYRVRACIHMSKIGLTSRDQWTILILGGVAIRAYRLVSQVRHDTSFADTADITGYMLNCTGERPGIIHHPRDLQSVFVSSFVFSKIWPVFHIFTKDGLDQGWRSGKNMKVKGPNR